MKKVRMSMNIESQKVSQTNKVEVVKTSQAQAENTSNFADELKELEKEKKVSSNTFTFLGKNNQNQPLKVKHLGEDVANFREEDMKWSSKFNNIFFINHIF